MAYPTVSPLKCGHLSPPAIKFVGDAKPGETITMPSLSFFIQHPSGAKIVFDLSVRRDLTQYHPGQYKHILTRKPVSGEPDVKSALALGNVSTDEVDFVIMSHVHWDHVGTPSDFTKATFISGPLTGKLLRNELGPHYHNPYFEPELLPKDRTIELDQVAGKGTDVGANGQIGGVVGRVQEQKSTVMGTEFGFNWTWKPLGPIHNVIDFFGDESVYLVNSPGHAPGHLNCLVRVSESQWVYLAADACHHARVFSGEVDFGRWEEKGERVTIHKDEADAYETLRIMRELRDNGLEGVNVEVVLAHDAKWQQEKAEFFFPNHLY